MLRAARSLVRLLSIARILARNDALAPLEQAGVAKPVVWLARQVSRRHVPGRPGQKLARALTELGPSFIKLGQFVSTRSDLVGEEISQDLAELQDHLPPFDSATAREIVEEELGAPIEQLFAQFDAEPKSAASIAQVHMAETTEGRAVAVKVLRPGIERGFERDLDLFYWLAGLVERAQPSLRRLKPLELVRLFEEQVRFEMNLTMEAAAAHELAENFADDPTYNVPPVDWMRTSRRVLTAGRIDGIPLDDRDALVEAGHDVDLVLQKAAAIFFRQVFRDGYFHGDQHPGNMFVDAHGNIVAVDFGIMGRLDKKTRFLLADMLLALLDRDYLRLAEVQLEVGYLPSDSPDAPSVESFAQALRGVCEPIFGRPLHEISFGRLLGQLFALSESFALQIQPQLLLLQKNMMMAEGVSRALKPELNIWTLAQPLVEDWMWQNRGPQARVQQAVRDWTRVARQLPGTLDRVERIVQEIETGGGLRVHPDTARAMGAQRGNGWIKLALALSASALALAAFALGVVVAG
jgi:ubiquinone biosynthesis protein